MIIKKVGTNCIKKAAKLVVGDKTRDVNIVVRLMKIAEEKAKGKLSMAKMRMNKYRRKALVILPARWLRKKFL